MNNPEFIVVGSGAGGSAAAYALASAGRRVVLLEQGPRLPDDGSTLQPGPVLREGRFKSTEVWHDRAGHKLVPEEFFNLGGKTRWYGAALLRFAPTEFEGDTATALLPWPFGYSEMAPYYERAEQLLEVRSFRPESALSRISSQLRRTGWQAEPLPLGLKADIGGDAATRFDGFAIPGGLKSDAQHRLLDRVAGRSNLQILTGAAVTDLLADPYDARHIAGVRLADGRAYYGTVLLAAGALHSPRLLQRYLEAHQLEQRLPAAANVGRNFKRHLLTAVLAFSLRPQDDRLRKTLLLTHASHPHSTVQPLGGWIDREIVRLTLPQWIPGWMTEFFARRVYGFFLQTEDGSDPDNRVISSRHSASALLYYPETLPQATEHRRLVRRFMLSLFRIGLLPFRKAVPLEGTAHACGTLATGRDPTRSVVDPAGRVHGLTNLYVVDGSVLPRSGRMNPALTIYAWSLRVADLLLGKKNG